MERRIGREMMVPKKEKPGSVQVIRAGPSCNIYGTAGSGVGTQVHVNRGHLKLLDHFLRESKSGAAISDLHHAAAVDGDAGSATVITNRRSQQAHQYPVGRRFHGWLRARLQFDELQIVSAVHRQAFDLKPGNPPVHLVGLVLHLW